MRIVRFCSAVLLSVFAFAAQAKMVHRPVEWTLGGTRFHSVLVYDAADGPLSFVSFTDAVRRGAEVDARTRKAATTRQIGVALVVPEGAPECGGEHGAAELEARSDELEVAGLVREHDHAGRDGDWLGAYPSAGEKEQNDCYVERASHAVPPYRTGRTVSKPRAPGTGNDD